MRKLNWTAIGLTLLAIALTVVGVVIYKSSKTAAQSLTTASNNTAGLNQLATDVDAALKSSGLV